MVTNTKSSRVQGPTIKQIKAVEAIVENGGNVSKAMRKVGYSKAMSGNPQRLTRSKGFIQLAKECGLTETFLTRALVADIKAKKKNRKAELELGFKVLGRLKDNGDTPPANIINLNFFNADQLRKIAARTIDGDTESAAEPTGLRDSDESEVRTELAS